LNKSVLFLLLAGMEDPVSQIILRTTNREDLIRAIDTHLIDTEHLCQHLEKQLRSMNDHENECSKNNVINLNAWKRK